MYCYFTIKKIASLSHENFRVILSRKHFLTICNKSFSSETKQRQSSTLTNFVTKCIPQIKLKLLFHKQNNSLKQNNKTNLYFFFHSQRRRTFWKIYLTRTRNRCVKTSEKHEISLLHLFIKTSKQLEKFQLFLLHK